MTAPHPCRYPIKVGDRFYRTCDCHFFQPCSAPAPPAPRPRLVAVGQ